MKDKISKEETENQRKKFSKLGKVNRCIEYAKVLYLKGKIYF